MTIGNYTFVALDLETTGLDPNNDTIIEVAAVKFTLEIRENTFQIASIDERTMLIDPERELKEEIIMITGISQEMLHGRKKWIEVKEKIHEFIGDAIIVGHNVLFDINMLRSHGIPLTENIALDTFELSEIFSQDAASLNLGFLGKTYNIEMESEHRALDDTKLSIELFLIYLNKFLLITEKEKHLWNAIAKKETTNTLKTLLSLVNLGGEFGSYGIGIPYSLEKKGQKRNATEKEKNSDIRIINLPGERKEEIALFKETLKTASSVLIITPNKKQSLFLEKTLQQEGIRSGIVKNKSNFCSIEMIEYWLNKESLTRKEAIFLIKLIYWIENTKTGLLDELKYYGEERNFIGIFYCSEDEKNPFYDAHRKELEEKNVVLSDLFTKNLEDTPILTKSHTLILRDIILSEDIIRRAGSFHISFKELFGIIEEMDFLDSMEVQKDLTLGLSIIQDIYISIPKRPTGQNDFPPGEFGETYLIHQEKLWHEGGKWLIFGSQKLETSLIYLQKRDARNPEEKKQLANLITNLETLIHTSHFMDGERKGIILSIHESDIKISFIPRSIKDNLQKIINTQSGGNAIITGYGLDGMDTKKFLENECGLSQEIEGSEKKAPIINMQKEWNLTGNKIVILTTNTRHIRAIVSDIKTRNIAKNIYGQGISGGKGKMLSLFLNSQEKSILVGLYDSWIDEMELWSGVDYVVFLKIPFDPPSDPYFLARTSGMKNNFEEYSTPLAISTINTLAGRIHFIDPEIYISCTDERLESMSWGIKMKKYLL